MAGAEIYNRGGTDKTVILRVRQWAKQPFQAPNWTDLRVGFLLSLCKPDPDDNLITGLAQTIPNPGVNMPPENRYWIGVKTRNDAMPGAAQTTFIGFTNARFAGTTRDIGDSKLLSSDAGIGTTNTNFWRPSNGTTPEQLGGIFDGHIQRILSRPGCEQHFFQTLGGGGEYATLLMLRLQRDEPGTRRITVTTKTSDAHSGDVLFTNTPTKDLLLTNLQTFPATVQTWGPAQLSLSVPDALYAYWPFNLSRLRIHCWGVLRVA